MPAAAVVKNLTPDAILPADYDLAQMPVLGAERQAYLSSKESLLLGIATLTATGVVKYEFVNAPLYDANPNPLGPIAAFVLGELKADAAAVVTLGDLTATFQAAEYSNNQSFDFGASRGIELVGPNAAPITRNTVPTITNAKIGSRIAFVQLPKYADFYLVGATKAKDVDVPSVMGKLIGDGMDSSRYSKKGKTKEGKLKITGADLGADAGLRRFAGFRCAGMLETKSEEKIVVDRQFFTNYVPGLSNGNPEQDNESTLDAEGPFQHMITLVAPGTVPQE